MYEVFASMLQPCPLVMDPLARTANFAAPLLQPDSTRALVPLSTSRQVLPAGTGGPGGGGGDGGGGGGGGGDGGEGEGEGAWPQVCRQVSSGSPLTPDPAGSQYPVPPTTAHLYPVGGGGGDEVASVVLLLLLVLALALVVFKAIMLAAAPTAGTVHVVPSQVATPTRSTGGGGGAGGGGGGSGGTAIGVPLRASLPLQ